MKIHLNEKPVAAPSFVTPKGSVYKGFKWHPLSKHKKCQLACDLTLKILLGVVTFGIAAAVPRYRLGLARDFLQLQFGWEKVHHFVPYKIPRPLCVQANPLPSADSKPTVPPAIVRRKIPEAVVLEQIDNFYLLESQIEKAILLADEVANQPYSNEVCNALGKFLVEAYLTHKVDDSAVLDALRKLPVSELDLQKLTGNRSIVDAELCKLIAACPGLEVLDLAGTKITDLSACQLGALQNLKVLGLNRTAIGDSTLQALSKLTHIQELNIGSCRNLTSEGLIHLRSMLTLTTLNIEYNALLSNHALVTLIPCLSNLKKLILNGTRIDDEAIKTVANLTDLRFLGLGHCDHLSDDALNSIASMHALEVLDLTNGKFSFYALAALGYCNNLHALLLGDIRFSERGFEEIAKLKNLKILEAGNLSYRMIRQLPKLSNLSTLLLSNLPDLEDEDLPHIAGLKHLSKLKLDNCHRLTDHAIGALSHLKSLKELTLGSCEKITDVSIRSLARLSCLEKLELTHARKLTDRSLEQIAKLKNLKSLKGFKSAFSREALHKFEKEHPAIEVCIL